jgi:hypothetical protein
MAGVPPPEGTGSKAKGSGKKFALPFREVREKIKQSERLSEAKVLLDHKK